MNADLATYEQTQARIAAINRNGVPVADYSLSKAQCWLDASLEAKTEVNPETPLINNADRLREDLWGRIGNLKNAKGFACYAQKLACAEVELVHAVNEHKQQGWRHAKPYIQIAEDLIADADATGDSCLPQSKEPSAKMPEHKVERLDLSADALFRFNKAGANDLLPDGKAELDALVARLQDVYAQIEKITLIGYTDRLGSEQYNQRLSEQRAHTVKQYLQQIGITSPIDAVGRGEADQVAQCVTDAKASKALIDCLQPNRRVSIEIKGLRKSD